MSTTTRHVVLTNVLCTAPLHGGWSANKKYWVATITHNKSKPGGFERSFWPRTKTNPAGTKTPAYIIPNYLNPGTPEGRKFRPVEFGADTVQGKSRDRSRFYGVARVELDADGNPWLIVHEAHSPEYAMSWASDLNADIDAGTDKQPVPVHNVTGVPLPEEPAAEQPTNESETDMDTDDILGVLTGLEQAICEEDWGGAEYMAEQILRAVGTKKRAAAVKARREEIEREQAWEKSHPGAGKP